MDSNPIREAAAAGNIDTNPIEIVIRLLNHSVAAALLVRHQTFLIFGS